MARIKALYCAYCSLDQIISLQPPAFVHSCLMVVVNLRPDLFMRSDGEHSQEVFHLTSELRQKAPVCQKPVMVQLCVWYCGRLPRLAGSFLTQALGPPRAATAVELVLQ